MMLSQDAFIGGTHTMSVTTSWTMSEIFRNPSVMEKACAELQTVVGDNRLVQESDLPQLKYLQCIMKETFRLHPAGPLLLPHESVEPCKASGYDIPAKTRMMVNVYAIGRDPSVWEDPSEFKPERFEEGEIESKIDVRGQDFVLIPFGSGRRMCPAVSMANLVVQFVVASLLHTFQWSLPDGMDPKDLDMTEGMGLTVTRAVPLRAIATLRLASSLYDA
jgi:cytochrome P450